MKSLYLFCLAWILPGSQSVAATVSFGLSTSSYSQSPLDRPVSVTSEDFFLADLSDRAGLTAGMPVLITLGPVSPPFPLWIGSFQDQEGELRLDFRAILGVAAGGLLSSKSLEWNETLYAICPCEAPAVASIACIVE